MGNRPSAFALWEVPHQLIRYGTEEAAALERHITRSFLEPPVNHV